MVSRTVTYTGGNGKSNFKVKCVNINDNKDYIHSSETATRGGLSDELALMKLLTLRLGTQTQLTRRRRLNLVSRVLTRS